MGFFSSSNKSASKEGGKTIIADGCRIKGEFSRLDGELHVDGKIEGVVDTSFDISVGESGVIKGLVKARTLVISGVVEGHVACDRVEIIATGKLIGDIICREFVVEAQAKFIGQRHELAEGGRVLSMPDVIDSQEHKRLLEFAGLQETSFDSAEKDEFLVVDHLK